MPEPAPQRPEQNRPATVNFFFEKTSSFQTLHADGALSSVTPSGQAFLAFYVERAPIPKTLVYSVNTEGTIDDKPISMTGKQGVFREIQSAVILSPTALNALKTHIENILKQIENASKSS